MTSNGSAYYSLDTCTGMVAPRNAHGDALLGWSVWKTPCRSWGKCSDTEAGIGIWDGGVFGRLCGRGEGSWVGVEVGFVEVRGVVVVVGGCRRLVDVHLFLFFLLRLEWK